ncbi:MAG: TfoX/Sxy family protein [Desulfobulbaceae bacterium]|nr:TfoX/Sxy family protein [Desulfobulbaceae bacterium]
MSHYNEFVALVIEQMSFFDNLHVRAMFGGHGIYQCEYIFAIIVDDRLYFKTDSSSQREFEDRGLMPFTYVSRGKLVTMRYFEAPPEVFEDTDAMFRWGRKALGVAVKTDNSKKRKQSKSSNKL